MALKPLVAFFKIYLQTQMSSIQVLGPPYIEKIEELT